MPRSVAAQAAARPKTADPDGQIGSGRVPTDDVLAVEGLVEALAGGDNDARQLEETGRICAIAAQQLFARAKFIRDQRRPRLQVAYAAAERVVDLQRERRIRIARGRSIVVAATRRAA